MQVESDQTQSPLFAKTWDFLLWLQDHTEKFPKSERFRLAKRLEDSAFDFHESLICAAKSSQKELYLHQAELNLTKTRFYLRMAHARKLTSANQYRYAYGLLVEIGKLLGGWMKSHKQRA